jgi:hypothetical protein
LSDPVLKGRNEGADCRYHVICVLLAVACIRLTVEPISAKPQKERWQTLTEAETDQRCAGRSRALRQDVSEVEAGVKALGKSATNGEKRRENIKTALAGNPALLLLCLTLSLTACTSAPKKSPPIIQEPLPESLTAKTETPASPPRPMR